MNVVAIVPIRISESSRRKLLRESKGKTPLEHTVLSLIGSGFFVDVIIAAPDDGHAEYYTSIAKRCGAKIFVGEKENINRRVSKALSEHRYAEGIAVRVNGENIFNLSSLTVRVLDAVRDGNAEYSYLSGLPNGLAPDAVSITSLKKFEEMDAPYYRTLKDGVSDLIVSKVDSGLELEALSFTAVDDEAEDLFNHHSSALPSASVEQFLESAREFYKDSLERAAIPKKREVNFKLNAIEKGLKLEQVYSMPISMSLGVSNLCNLKCVTCIQRFSKLSQDEFDEEFGEGYKYWDISFDKRDDGNYYKKSDELTPEAFSKIEKVFFPYLISCSFGLSGEPFMNKNLPDYIEIAKKYGIETHMLTNGMTMDETVSEKIAGGILDKINISFDGATRETFEGIRSGSDFERIKRNIRTLAKIRDRSQVRSPNINLAPTISAVNFRELPDIVKLGGDLGVDSVTVKYAITAPFMNREESLFWRMEETQEVFEKTKEQARRSGIVVWLPKVAGGGSSGRSSCRVMWEAIIIRIGGMTTPCCHITRNELLLEDGLQDIWNGDFYRKLRRGHSGKELLIEDCINCSDDDVRDPSNINSFIYSAESSGIF